MPDSSFAYDAVPYPSAVFAQTHPDRLATIGRLLGMSPAGVPEARVLEIGCGDGSNLLGMACELPRAQFVGIDLSGQAIDRGQRSISGLGVTNLALYHSGVGDIPADLGRFDFILAHGLYSWVPAEVRDRKSVV